MIRNRSRAVNTTQSLMSDPPSLPSQSQTQTQNKTKPYSLLLSPRLLMGFSPKIFSENEAIMSPTSILDSKNLHSISTHPLFTNQKKEKPSCLGLVDALDDHEQNHTFSPKPKIQIPSFEGNFKIEFGVRNRESKLAFLSPGGRYKLKQNVDINENDRSEEYTCVILRGPNPKTMHIFDDRVINGDLGNSELHDWRSRNGKEFCECENQEAIIGEGLQKTSD